MTEKVDDLASRAYSKAMRRNPSHLPAAISLGAASQIGQLVIVRELLMVFHGNELSIGIILSVWLAWVGVGSRLGAYLCERSKRPARLLVVTAAVSALALPAGVLLIRVLRSFFHLPPGAHLSIPDMFFSCLGVLAPVCLPYGILFVCLTRLWREHEEGSHAGGWTYIAEAVGTFAGGLAFSLALVHLMKPLATAALAGALMVALALFVTPVRRARSLRIAWTAAIAVAALFAPTILGRLENESKRLLWRLLAPDHELAAVARSRYGAIAVLERQGQYSVFQSGNLLFSTAGEAERVATDFEEQEALLLAHFAMVQHENPRRVLLIGGGLRGTIREILRHPVERVDYIELDPDLTAAVRPFLGASTVAALDDERVRLIHTDGRLFVRNATETYDMIIVDVPDPATAVLNRYYTEEFFRAAAALLEAEKGVFVISLASGADLRGRAAANRNSTIFHTLSGVFPQVLPAGDRPLFFFAGSTTAAISSDPAVLAARFSERAVHSDAFSPHHYLLLLQEQQLRRMNWIIRNHGQSPEDRFTPPSAGPIILPSLAEQAAVVQPPADQRWFINRDFKPIGYFYTLDFWSQKSRGRPAGMFDFILRIEGWWILPVLGAVLLVAMLLRRLDRRAAGGTAGERFALAFTVMAMGLSTMAIQVALILSFQSVYGFIYEMVGLITALFMGGLALGAWLSQRLVKRESSRAALTVVQLVLAFFAVLIAFGLPGAATLRHPSLVFILFAAATVCAGLCNGADFPLITICYTRLSGRPDHAVGLAYGSELFGACLGAIMAGVMIAPVMGIAASCLLAAAANAAAALVLVVTRRAHGQT